MARLPRLCLPGITQHIIQRGNNRQICFASDEDFSAYAHWLEKFSCKYSVAIHAWVFMTNHVHLLVTPDSNNGVSDMMQSLGRQYVRYFNHTYQRTGTLWEGRFKSCVIDADNYLLTCQRYIELNPVRANMVSDPAQYKWSSYCTNANGRKVSLHTPHPLYLQLGKTVTERNLAYQELFRYQLDEELINRIRIVSNKGLALGNDHFKNEVEKLSGRRVTELKRGPKARDAS